MSVGGKCGRKARRMRCAGQPFYFKRIDQRCRVAQTLERPTPREKEEKKKGTQQSLQTLVGRPLGAAERVWIEPLTAPFVNNGMGLRSSSVSTPCPPRTAVLAAPQRGATLIPQLASDFAQDALSPLPGRLFVGHLPIAHRVAGECPQQYLPCSGCDDLKSAG